jgi:chromosome partitioning protein
MAAARSSDTSGSLPRRIAVVAHKGGAGKTTVTLNLGAALAARGQRVLLVDCDPQGSLGVALGVAEEPPTLVDVLTERVPAAEAIRETGVERLALLPADQSLTSVEDELFGRAGWHQALRRALAPLDQFDAILVDTPPGLGVLSFMAMQGCDAVLIVCPPEWLAYRALPKALATLERARRLNPDLRLLGILPTLVDSRLRHERELLATMHEEYGALVLLPVPRRAALRDATRAGRPITQFAPRSDAAAVFMDLARVIADR